MSKKSTKNGCAAIPAIDAQWRARDDADTLRRAGEIMGDNARFGAAKAEVKKSIDGLQKISRVGARSPSLGLAKGRR